jgi:hypothetical protein
MTTNEESNHKRKRDQNEPWERVVVRKLDDEKLYIRNTEYLKEKRNKNLYALFNDLQAISAK